MKPTAVILAAGRGTRVNEIAPHKPKAMVKYLGKPVLEHILDSLCGSVDQCVIVVGSKKEQIIDHFGHKYKDISLWYTQQMEPKGTTDATLCALPFVKNSMILLFCDNIFHPSAVRNVAATPDSMLFYRSSDPRNYGLLQKDGPPFTSILEKPDNTVPFKRWDGTYNCFVGCVHLSNRFKELIDANRLDVVLESSDERKASIPTVIGQYASMRPLQGFPLYWGGKHYTPLGTVAEFSRAYQNHGIRCSDTRQLVWEGQEWQSRPLGPGDEHRPLVESEKEFLLVHYGKPPGVLDIDRTAPWKLDNM